MINKNEMTSASKHGLALLYFTLQQLFRCYNSALSKQINI